MTTESSEVPVLRFMTEQDIPAVVQLIATCDDDEVDEARADYTESVADQFVFEQRGQLLGVTGFEAIEGTDRAYWLGWTFMDPERRTPELGATMIEELLGFLRGLDARKLFVRTSDWMSGGFRCWYRFQRDLFAATQFGEELRHADYYDRREAMIGWGLHMSTPGPADPPLENDERTIVSLGIKSLDDCEGVGFFDWEAVDEPEQDGIAEAIEKARAQKLRAVFASAASHAIGAAQQLEAAGFRRAGRWADFHEDGLHDEQFRLDLR